MIRIVFVFLGKDISKTKIPKDPEMLLTIIGMIDKMLIKLAQALIKLISSS